MADGATAPLKGSDANRKPDLILISQNIQYSPLDWRDVHAVGEMKIRNTAKTCKKSYIKAAGKTALLLYAQDGRHSAPCLQILGTSVVLTFFDRGGSLSTAPIDIHKHPEEFLRVLIGLVRASRGHLGFHETLIWRKDGTKRMLVVWEGEVNEVTLEKLIFISNALHGRGSTVWCAGLHPVSSEPSHPLRQVVVKDSWIDPLRKFSEGSILARLNATGIKGVPKLIREQQVQGPHLSRPDLKVNKSTHFIRTLLPDIAARPYHVRTLSRLITEPVGQTILEFSSLVELLLAFIDYVLSEC